MVDKAQIYSFMKLDYAIEKNQIFKGLYLHV